MIDRHPDMSPADKVRIARALMDSAIAILSVNGLAHSFEITPSDEPETWEIVDYLTNRPQSPKYGLVSETNLTADELLAVTFTLQNVLSTTLRTFR
jgi:hypothetical protein